MSTEARGRGGIPPRAEITGSCELSRGSWELNLTSLQEHPALLIAELFLSWPPQCLWDAATPRIPLSFVPYPLSRRALTAQRALPGLADGSYAFEAYFHILYCFGFPIFTKQIRFFFECRNRSRRPIKQLGFMAHLRGGVFFFFPAHLGWNYCSLFFAVPWNLVSI